MTNYKIRQGNFDINNNGKHIYMNNVYLNLGRKYNGLIKYTEIQ